MKTVELFYLEGCPYCINAKKALMELRKEKPQYHEIQVKWIEESKERALADQYDYYYVPTIFYEGEKLYEADPSESYRDIKSKMDSALKEVCRKE